MKINVIGVPLNLGCDRAGVERAPNHLRERGLMGVIRKNGHKAFDLGNLYVPPVSEADKFVRGNSMKYLDAIVEVNTNLAELVYDVQSYPAEDIDKIEEPNMQPTVTTYPSY